VANVSAVVARLRKNPNIPVNADAFSSMMRKPKNTVGRFLVRFSLLVSLFFGIFIYSQFRPVSSRESWIEIEIPRGSSVATIANKLHKENLLRSPLAFRLYVKFSDLNLQAGIYTLSPHYSLQELALSLTEGYAKEVTLTIPEGLRVEQIAELVSSKLGTSSTEFIKLAKAKEGYLFPNTYRFADGTTNARVLEKLTTQFSTETKNLNITKDDVILASIIERETLSDAEKPVVAGILKKRLAENWPLEVDASIQYIMGSSQEWWPIPLLGDRKRPSTYNTYLNRGLPPTPICNPGLASLRVATNPESSPYYFYLHDKSGGIHYATTLSEHTANIAKYISQ